MAENSHISWTDNTFNPWMGCTKVSPACTNCYAEVDSPVRQSRSIGLELWGPKSKRRVNSEQSWNMPLRWNRQAAKDGKRLRVFCASLADVFEDNTKCQVVNHKDEPMYLNANDGGLWWLTDQKKAGPLALTLADMRCRLFEMIELTPNLDWLLLTKRPENVMGMVPPSWASKFPDNVWMGTTVDNQRYADERIPHLLSIPARIHFLSCEPMVGHVNLREEWMPHEFNREPSCYHCETCVGCRQRWQDIRPESHGPFLKWVIAGGESGTNARPAHPDWYRSLRDQCEAAGVAFHFKQWGEWLPFHKNSPCIRKKANGELIEAHVDDKVYADLQYDENDDNWVHVKVGKKNAGRLFEGREWNEVVPA